MVFFGYDTDELTERQRLMFTVMADDWGVYSLTRTCIPCEFLKMCVQNNYKRRKFSTYDGDCNAIYKLAEIPGFDLSKYVRMYEQSYQKKGRTNK